MRSPFIADFHGEHVAGEIIEFSKIAAITRRELQRALSNEVITPGKTTYHDVTRWLDERRQSLGLRRTWYPGMAFVAPGSQGYQRLVEGSERVIHRGDIPFLLTGD